MLKKTTLAVIGLIASGFATAGTMGDVCTPGNVTVPCEANQWDFGIQALYLKAIYGDARSSVIFALDQPAELKNKWNWGFNAEGSYHYGPGNDITIDWTHYSSNTDQDGLVGLIPVPPLVATFSMSNENRLDQINVVAGQHTDVGLFKKIRFYGGMQYADLQVNVTDFFPSFRIAAIGANSPIEFFDNTDFTGFGPVVGIDYSYNITPAIKVTANGSGSLLYGTTRYNAGYLATNNGLVLTSRYRALKTIVPTVEAKLGLNYEYNMAQGVMNFEGGYQVTNYFNALQAQPLQIILAPVSTINYGLYGPYLGVKYLGNA